MSPAFVDLDFIAKVIAASEQTYLKLANSDGLERPEMDDAVQNFRHTRKDDKQLVFLKGVRYMSLLNATMALFKNGFTHEMNILARCMDEALEDAMFFIRGLEEDGTLSLRQIAAMDEFYQEEFVDLSVGMLRNKERRRVPRRNIRAAIAALPENEVNRHDAAHVHASVYDALSGYVHGAYPHIMELYGGFPARFHVRGMRHTPRQVTAARTLATYAYRGILMGQCAAMKLCQPDTLDRLFQIRWMIEERYPHLAQDPLEALAALKRER